ncbi:MAG: ribosome-associated translation inhibitor RaiA [Dehalococcoidia bacterium]|nr:ribosome-associated translation inhibitor RaiA [Dehalococcoidia bacterium]
MELQVNGKNVEISDSLRSLVEKKITKLKRFLPTIREVKVELSHEKAKSPDQRYTAQVTINNNGILLRGEERAENIQTALDAVAEVLARQIKRYKEKRYDKGRGKSAVRQTGVSTTVTEREPSVLPEGIVKVKSFRVKPMSVSEALEQMELLGHNFFLFVNSETSKFNCLYRRNDGNYGLIEADLE